MGIPFRALAVLAALGSLLGGLATPAAAQADRASEEAVKAGFVYNFAKFADWPADGSGDETAPLRICAPAADPLAGRLVQLQGRMLQGRPIVVNTGVRAGDWHKCHVLFLSADDAVRVEGVLRGLAHAPVLTVGDLPGFVQAGGMIGLLEADQRIRFEVNLAAAQRAGLRLSSQMLKLASRVLQ